MATSFGGDQRTTRDSGPSGSAAAMTSTTAYQQGRAILFNCTVAGTSTVTFPDATTIVLTFPAAGIYEFNFAAVKYTAGTATHASVYNLY